MTLSLLPLLIHEHDLPAAARTAIALAQRATPADRTALLEVAAWSLTRDTELDCADAYELLGLTAPGGC